MNKVIVDLTEYLIVRNSYDRAFKRIRKKSDFIEHVKRDVRKYHLSEMTQEQTDLVICLYIVGDILISDKEIATGINWPIVSSEELVNDLTTLFLAHAIYARLDPNRPGFVPPWVPRVLDSQRGLAKMMDHFANGQHWRN